MFHADRIYQIQLAQQQSSSSQKSSPRQNMNPFGEKSPKCEAHNISSNQSFYSHNCYGTKFDDNTSFYTTANQLESEHTFLDAAHHQNLNLA